VSGVAQRTETELCYLSAAEALSRFRDRSLSPVELLDAVIARAEAVEPTVNALCHERFDAARDEARLAEARYAGRGEAPRALEGLPVAIKEEEPIAGHPWTLGSLIYADQVADRTSTPEFSCAGFTHTRLWGVTRNPFNPALAVGGSSGGSAASLASGTSTLASGSDIGGSIRMPAAACGVVGFKPPHGRVPCDPPFNLDLYCHCGPLARTVGDCALYENVVAGPAAEDHTTLRDPLVLPDVMPGVQGLRIAVSPDLGDWPVEADVRANTLAVGDALREAGATVEEVELRLSRADVMRAAAIHFHHGFAAAVGREVAAHPDLVNSYVTDMVRRAAETCDGADVTTGWELEAALWAPLGALFERFDALIVPTSCRAGLEAGEDYVETLVRAAGVELTDHLENFLTPVFNLFSRCPVLAVPSGVGAGNAPTGVQIAGRTFDDLTPFRVGAALEAVRPWDRWSAEVVVP
jgi:amidase